MRSTWRSCLEACACSAHLKHCCRLQFSGQSVLLNARSGGRPISHAAMESLSTAATRLDVKDNKKVEKFKQASASAPTCGQKSRV